MGYEKYSILRLQTAAVSDMTWNADLQNHFKCNASSPNYLSPIWLLDVTTNMCI